jgi:hypothetical protein
MDCNAEVGSMKILDSPDKILAEHTEGRRRNASRAMRTSSDFFAQASY